MRTFRIAQAYSLRLQGQFARVTIWLHPTLLPQLTLDLIGACFARVPYMEREVSLWDGTELDELDDPGRGPLETFVLVEPRTPMPVPPRGFRARRVH